MTSMVTITAFSGDPNDPDAVNEHQRAVFAAHALIFGAIDAALRHAVPTALETLALLGGPRDRAVHATLTRFIVRTALQGDGFHAEDESLEAELEWVPNCGICVHGLGVEIRMLKASDGQIPKAGSVARSRFYCSNQMSLFDETTAPPRPKLKLVALWDVDQDFGYVGLEIACPKGELEDRTVDCYWKSYWSQPAASAQDAGSQAASAEESDLDIRPANPASDDIAGV